jgi:hypothetical protein
MYLIIVLVIWREYNERREKLENENSKISDILCAILPYNIRIKIKS